MIELLLVIAMLVTLIAGWIFNILAWAYLHSPEWGTYIIINLVLWLISCLCLIVLFRKYS